MRALGGHTGNFGSHARHSLVGDVELVSQLEQHTGLLLAGKTCDAKEAINTFKSILCVHVCAPVRTCTLCDASTAVLLDLIEYLTVRVDSRMCEHMRKHDSTRRACQACCSTIHLQMSTACKRVLAQKLR